MKTAKGSFVFGDKRIFEKNGEVIVENQAEMKKLEKVLEKFDLKPDVNGIWIYEGFLTESALTKELSQLVNLTESELENDFVFHVVQDHLGQDWNNPGALSTVVYFTAQRYWEANGFMNDDISLIDYKRIDEICKEFGLSPLYELSYQNDSNMAVEKLINDLNEKSDFTNDPNFAKFINKHID